MPTILRGRVHGKTIEFTEELGLIEGQEVEVQVKVLPPTQVWGEGLRRCAGALADEWTEEDDAILEEIYQARKLTSKRDINL